MQVNAETLQANIQRLEGWKRHCGALTINEEYQLEAYRMLLVRLVLEGRAEQGGEYGHD